MDVRSGSPTGPGQQLDVPLVQPAASYLLLACQLMVHAYGTTLAVTKVGRGPEGVGGSAAVLAWRHPPPPTPLGDSSNRQVAVVAHLPCLAAKPAPRAAFAPTCRACPPPTTCSWPCAWTPARWWAKPMQANGGAWAPPPS